MKELLRKLSSLFHFSKESRLANVDGGEAPSPTPEGVGEEKVPPPITGEEAEKMAEETREAGQLKPRGQEKALEEFAKMAEKAPKEVKVETAGVVGEPGKIREKGPEVKPEMPEGVAVAEGSPKAPPGLEPGFAERVAAMRRERLSVQKREKLAEAGKKEAEEKPEVREPRTIEPEIAEAEMPETGPIVKPEELKKSPEVVPRVLGEKPEEKPRIAVDTESVEEVEE